MRSMYRAARMWIMLVLALAALMACAVASAEGDAVVERFEASVVVTREGALEFTETLDYYVTDDINGFTRDLDPSLGAGLSGFSVRSGGMFGDFEYDEDASRGDEGVYRSEQLSDGLVRYYVYLPCRDGDRVTLEYSYRLEGACARYRDVGVLELPLLGDGWEVEIERFSARLSFEGGAPEDIDLRINSAGMALDMDATGARDGAVYFEGRDAGDGNDALRVRIMFPADMLSGMDYTLDADMGEQILNQEAELDELTRLNTRRGVVQFCALLLACLGLCAMACFKWGRDPQVEVGEYSTGAPLPLEPGVTPAELRYAVAQSSADANALAATMLDLARRGIIRIEGGDQPEYVYEGQSLNTCAEHERYALDWIMGMGDGHRVSLEQIRKCARRSGYSTAYGKWSSMVSRAAKAHGWYCRRERVQIGTGVTLLVAFALMLGTGIWSLNQGSAYELLGMFQIFSSVALLVSGLVALLINKRTEGGARVERSWHAVSKWLKSDWDARELPPDAELLELLMVYALVLGRSDKLAKKLDALDPSYAQAMRDSGRTMRIFEWNSDDDLIDLAVYGAYCTRAHSSMSEPSSSSSSGSSSGSGAGGGGGGGTF